VAAQSQRRHGRSVVGPGSAVLPYSMAAASEDVHDDDEDADQGQQQQQQQQRDKAQTANHATPQLTVVAGYFRSRATAHVTHCTLGYV